MKDIYWVGISLSLYWFVTYIFKKYLNFKDYDRKSTLKAYLIWLIGGVFGLHNIYLKFEKKNKIYAFSMLVFLFAAYFFSWIDEQSLIKIVLNFETNTVLLFLFTSIVFQHIIDFFLMRFLVFKSNYAEKTSPAIDFSEQLTELRKEVKQVNNRIAEDLKQDIV